MTIDNLTRRIPMSRQEVQVRDAFLLVRQEEFYIVERGHVDLFRVVLNDQHEVQIKAPFIARIPAGGAFFGSLSVPLGRDGDLGFLAYQAVPAHQTVLLRGQREQLASPDSFDLDAVNLIDDWVVASSEFVADHETPPPGMLLLEADPDIPYQADSSVSTHHREVLWVSVDRPGLLVGHPQFPVAEGALVPLSEHTWLALPEEARVSAVHTPGTIVTGRLWAALDRHNVQVLRCAEQYYVETHEQISIRHALGQRTNARLRAAMLRELTNVLADGPVAGAGRARRPGTVAGRPPPAPCRIDRRTAHRFACLHGRRPVHGGGHDRGALRHPYPADPVVSRMGAARRAVLPRVHLRGRIEAGGGHQQRTR